MTRHASSARSNASQSSASPNTSRRLSRRYAVGATVIASPARFIATHSSVKWNTPFNRDTGFTPPTNSNSFVRSNTSAGSNTQPQHAGRTPGGEGYQVGEPGAVSPPEFSQPRSGGLTSPGSP